MSLLMEALRKAEAAKNKAEGNDADDESSKLTLEPKETEEAREEKETRETKETKETEVTETPEAEPATENSPSSIELEDQQDDHEKDQEQSHEIEEVKFELESIQDDEVVQEEPDFAEAPQSAAEIADELLDEHPSEESFDLTMGTADEFGTAPPEPEIIEPQENISENTQADTIEALDQKIGGADELYGFIPEESVGSSNEEPAARETNEEDYEPQEAAEEFNQFERTSNQVEDEDAQPMSDQAIEDRQTANSLFQAKQNTQKNKRNRAIMLGLIVALLPIGGGGFYWYYSSSVNTSNMFPTNAVITAPPEGFFGETNAPEPVAADADAAELLAETDEPADENIDLEAIVAVLEESEEPVISAPDLDPGPLSDPAEEPVVADAAVLIAGNAQTALGGESLDETIPPEPAVEIQLTRTTSRPEVNPDLLAAYESYQQSDLGQARRLYAQVLETQPNNRDALLGLALINRQEDNIAQAQALYSRLLQLNPRDPLARAGLLESGQNRTDAAQQESQLRALQNEYPNVAPLAFALGNLFASQSRWNEAQNAYFDALLIAREVDSNMVSPDYAFNLAVSLERLNQLDLAYNYYQQALDLSSSSPAGFNMENLSQRMTYLEEVLQ